MNNFFLALLLLAVIGSNALAQPFLMRYENLYVMIRAGRNATLPGAAMTEGQVARHDGLGQIYVWDQTSVASTNADGSVIAVPGLDVGRWFTLAPVGGSFGSLISNLSVGSYPVLSNATTFVNGAWYQVGGTNAGINSQIILGPGTTNVVFREGNDLVYTNGAQYPSFLIRGKNGVPAQYGLIPGNAGDSAQISGPFGVALGWDVASISFSGTNIYPTHFLNAGTLGNPFGNVQLQGSLLNYGFNPINGNDYSRLASYHTGTNGIAVIDSQSAGTAGNPRPIQIQFGSTNNVTFNPQGPTGFASITKAQKTALTPTNGMLVYQSDNTAGFRAYVGGAWLLLSTSADP